MCCCIIQLRPNYTVAYTWHEPPLPHSSVFKGLAGGSKRPGFDDGLALGCLGYSLNGIRVLHAANRTVTGY